MKGVLWALLAAWIYTTMALVVQFGSQTISNPMMVWARQLFGFCTLIPLLTVELRSEGSAFLKTSYLRLHIIRTLASLSAGYCLFFALSLLPLPEAVVLSNTRALWVPIYAWLLFGKRIEPVIWACLSIAFVGVVFVLNPGKALFEFPAIIGLLSGALSGGAFLSIRRLAKVEPPNRIPIFYFAMATCIASIPLMWAWEPLSARSWLIMVGIGAMAAGYQYCLTRAYRRTRASVVGGVLQVALVFSVFYDWIFHQRAPNWLAILGMVLIAGTSVWIVTATRARAQEG